MNKYKGREEDRDKKLCALVCLFQSNVHIPECAHIRMKDIKEVKREVKIGRVIYVQEVETVIK